MDVAEDKRQHLAQMFPEVITETRTPDGKPVAAAGEIALLSIRYDDGKPVETTVRTWKVETGPEGSAVQQITASRAGQYRLSAKLVDAASAAEITPPPRRSIADSKLSRVRVLGSMNSVAMIEPRHTWLHARRSSRNSSACRNSAMISSQERSSIETRSRLG